MRSGACSTCPGDELTARTRSPTSMSQAARCAPAGARVSGAAPVSLTDAPATTHACQTRLSWPPVGTIIAGAVLHLAIGGSVSSRNSMLTERSGVAPRLLFRPRRPVSVACEVAPWSLSPGGTGEATPSTGARERSIACGRTVPIPCRLGPRRSSGVGLTSGDGARGRVFTAGRLPCTVPILLPSLTLTCRVGPPRVSRSRGARSEGQPGPGTRGDGDWRLPEQPSGGRPALSSPGPA